MRSLLRCLLPQPPPIRSCGSRAGVPICPEDAQGRPPDYVLVHSAPQGSKVPASRTGRGARDRQWRPCRTAGHCGPWHRAPVFCYCRSEVTIVAQGAHLRLSSASAAPALWSSPAADLGLPESVCPSGMPGLACCRVRPSCFSFVSGSGLKDRGVAAWILPSCPDGKEPVTWLICLY